MSSVFPPWTGQMGPELFGVLSWRQHSTAVPALGLAVSSPDFPPHSPLPRREYHSGSVNVASVGLPSRALSMKTVLPEFAMVRFILQTLLFSIIDLLCPLSHIGYLWPWFAPGAAEKPPETVWCGDWMQFLFMFADALCPVLNWTVPLQRGPESVSFVSFCSIQEWLFSGLAYLSWVAPAVPGKEGL